MKICFFTLGCKVNQQESSALMSVFSRNGHEIVDDNETADVYIVNSCTVTLSGDRKSIQWIRRARKRNPDAIIVLCGCMPQAFPRKAEAVTEADIIIGSKHKSDIPRLVDEFIANRTRVVSIPPYTREDRFEELSGETDNLHTRAFIKIEDGCNRHCAYCVISRARGPARSRSVESIVKEVTRMTESGHREIVLTGVNIACYGQDTGVSLAEVVEAVAAIDKVKRIRISSLEMDMLDDEVMVRLSKIDKLCPHFHLCLQSGCDKTLREMGRLYDRDFYRRTMNRLRELFDRPGFSTDVIVGFPGETEEDFLDSLAFVQSCGFVRVHCITYSQRPGTVAADRPDQIENSVKQERNHIMTYKSEQTRDRIYASFIGFEDEVLLEQKNSEGYYTGYTKRYIPVLVRADEASTGDIVKVRLEKQVGSRMLASLVRY